MRGSRKADSDHSTVISNMLLEKRALKLLGCTFSAPRMLAYKISRCSLCHLPTGHSHMPNSHGKSLGLGKPFSQTWLGYSLQTI